MEDDDDGFNPEAIIQQLRAQSVRSKGPAKKNVVHEQVRQQAWTQFDEVATTSPWAGAVGNEQSAVFQDVISQMERDIERLTVANKELLKENKAMREDKSRLEEEMEAQKKSSGEALAKLRIRVNKLSKQLQKAQAAATTTPQKESASPRRGATVAHPARSMRQHNEPEKGFLKATVSDTMRRTHADDEGPFEQFLRRPPAPHTPAPSTLHPAAATATPEISTSHRSRGTRTREKRQTADESDDAIPILEIDLQALCTPSKA